MEDIEIRAMLVMVLPTGECSIADEDNKYFHGIVLPSGNPHRNTTREGVANNMLFRWYTFAINTKSKIIVPRGKA